MVNQCNLIIAQLFILHDSNKYLTGNCLCFALSFENHPCFVTLFLFCLCRPEKLKNNNASRTGIDVGMICFSGFGYSISVNSKLISWM